MTIKKNTNSTNNYYFFYGNEVERTEQKRERLKELALKNGHQAIPSDQIDSFRKGYDGNETLDKERLIAQALNTMDSVLNYEIDKLNFDKMKLEKIIELTDPKKGVHIVTKSEIAMYILIAIVVSIGIVNLIKF